MFNSLEGFVQVLQESEEIEDVANEMSSEYTELSTDEMLVKKIRNSLFSKYLINYTWI